MGLKSIPAELSYCLGAAQESMNLFQTQRWISDLGSQSPVTTMLPLVGGYKVSVCGHQITSQSYEPYRNNYRKTLEAVLRSYTINACYYLEK